MGRGSDRGACLARQWLVGRHSRQPHLVLRRRRRTRRFQPNIPAALHRLYDTPGVDVYTPGRRYLRLGDRRMVSTDQLYGGQDYQDRAAVGQPQRGRTLLGRLSRHWSAWFRWSARDDLSVSDEMIKGGDFSSTYLTTVPHRPNRNWPML